jgi:signal peptidase I
MKAFSSLIPSPSCLFTDTATGLLRQGLGVRFYAKGWSMYPTIKEGEIITVEPVKPSQVNPGDIILYQNMKGLIAHRVVAIQGGSNPQTLGQRFSILYLLRSLFFAQASSPNPHRLFFLRGDGEGKGSEAAEPRQILGKVVLIQGDRGAINPNLWKVKIGKIALLLFYHLKRCALRTIFRRNS